MTSRPATPANENAREYDQYGGESGWQINGA